jgi:hypothetical protein
VINADVAAHDWLVASASGFQLHPTLAGSADPVVRTAAVTTVTGGQSFHVPARTSAVFVQPQGASQGPGLPCNTR